VPAEAAAPKSPGLQSVSALHDLSEAAALKGPRELSALSKLTENDRRRGISPQADLAGPPEGG